MSVSCYWVVMFGAREWTDGGVVEREIVRMRDRVRMLYDELVIITGGADGADTLVEYYGKENNVHVAVVDALWKTRHRGAGPQRNSVMAAFNLNEGIGFHKNIAKSKGTKDMRNKLRTLHIPVRIVKR